MRSRQAARSFAWQRACSNDRVPPVLVASSWIAVVAALVSTLWIAVDVIRDPQQMWIMNVVWPVTGLYSGPLGVWAYVRIGRLSTKGRRAKGGEHKPFWQMALVAATHCGSGCTLGDLIVETAVIAVPVTIFGSRLAGTWTVDFVAAFLLGIAFQYFSIVPMRGLSFAEGLAAAVKADALSLTAWQVGMYGWMAIVTFVLFGHELNKRGPVFWFMMQIAMLGGFATAYPVNWWLLRRGIKERM